MNGAVVCAPANTPAPAAAIPAPLAAAETAITAVLSTLSALVAPSLAALSPALTALEVSKDGGQEDAEEEEHREDRADDTVGKDNGERLDDLEVDRREGLAREVASRIGPGIRRAMLLQRLCWLGEQLEHLLLERAHTQNLHEPELLQAQHLGMFSNPSNSLLSASGDTLARTSTR